MAVKYPPSRQLMADLQKKKFEKKYLFLGEEESEKDKAIDIIRKTLLPGEEDRRNYSGIFHIENDEFAAGVDFALSSSMFGPGRFCVMRNIDSLKSSQASQNLLRDLLSTLPDSTTLVMTSIKTASPSIIKEDLLGSISTFQFWKPFDRDIMTYIRSSLKKDSIDIDEEAVALIVERTGSDMRKIDEALDLLRFGKGRGSVDATVVRNLIEDSHESSIFRFIDLLFLKKRACIAELKKLLEEGTAELLILNRVAHQAEMLERYHISIGSGQGTEQAIKSAGVYIKKQADFIESSTIFPPEAVRKIFPLIARADRSLKSSRTTDHLTANPVLELCVSILSL